MESKTENPLAPFEANMKKVATHLQPSLDLTDKQTEQFAAVLESAVCIAVREMLIQLKPQ